MLFLFTCTALKVTEKKRKDTTADCDPRDWKDIHMVFQKGIQVEWMEFDYMSYMILREDFSPQ